MHLELCCGRCITRLLKPKTSMLMTHGKTALTSHHLRQCWPTEGCLSLSNPLLQDKRSNRAESEADARLQRHAEHLAGLRARLGTDGGDTAAAAGGATPARTGASRLAADRSLHDHQAMCRHPPTVSHFSRSFPTLDMPPAAGSDQNMTLAAALSAGAAAAAEEQVHRAAEMSRISVEAARRRDDECACLSVILRTSPAQCTADPDATLSLLSCGPPKVPSQHLQSYIHAAVIFLVHKTAIDNLVTTCDAGLHLRTALGLQQCCLWPRLW